jgi:hypothetical protein
MALAYVGEIDERASARPARQLLMVGVAIGVTMAAVGLRRAIVQLAPRTASLFELVGLTTNPTGLDIGRVSASIIADGSRRILVVDGDVANASSETRTIPAMQVAVRSSDGQLLYVWSTKPPRQKLAPGESAAFSARLASPPTDGADVVVEFDRTAKASGEGRIQKSASR